MMKAIELARQLLNAAEHLGVDAEVYLAITAPREADSCYATVEELDYDWASLRIIISGEES
jgi:hypothetical protein